MPLEIVGPAGDPVPGDPDAYHFDHPAIDTFDPTSKYYPPEIDLQWVLDNVGTPEERALNDRVHLATNSGFTSPIDTDLSVAESQAIVAAVVDVGTISRVGGTYEWDKNTGVSLAGKVIFTTTSSRSYAYGLARQEGARVSMSRLPQSKLRLLYRFRGRHARRAIATRGHAEAPPVMSEPYIMEWYPEDGGYASLAINSFDILSGTLDGINSAGLVVSILADNEAMWELGPKLEPHLGPQRAIGLHELAVMRLLLDTCATVAEAEETLLTIKQYYRLVPLHYIVADKAGHSFVFENSTGRNVQHVIEGTGQPQLITNHQLYKHPTPETIPGGPPRLEDVTSFWRYRQLSDRIASHQGSFTVEEMKANNDCVNSQKVVEEATRADPSRRDLFYGVNSRTVWHSLYDQQASTVEVSFYLGEDMQADGTRSERRIDYLKFTLEA